MSGCRYGGEPAILVQSRLPPEEESVSFGEADGAKIFEAGFGPQDMLRQAQGRWIGPVDRLGVEPAHSPGSGGNSRQ